MRLKPVSVALMAGGLFCVTAVHLEASPQQQPAAGQPKMGASSPTTASDRDTMQKIRKAIVDDKNLSTYAHNVKILAHDGKVTLRGPVRTEEEKRTVGSAAGAVVGNDNVTNELTIQPSK
jgi:hyperosmotically inducible periplasmic protein